MNGIPPQILPPTPPPVKKRTGWIVYAVIITFFLVLSVLANFGLLALLGMSGATDHEVKRERLQEQYVQGDRQAHDKIALIDLTGVISYEGDDPQNGEGMVGDIKDQLDRASTSIPLNIAEGNGKWSSRDRCRFLEIARGSAVECAACLDVLVAKHRLTVADVEPGKQQLHAIVSMLCGLIEAVANRVREEDVLYQIEQEKE